MPGYSLALPLGWHRLEVGDDDATVVRTAERRFLARDDDSARSALARHRFRETVTHLVGRARATGVVDLFVHSGPTRTGIGPMSLAVSVLAAPGLDDEALLRAGVDGSGPALVRVDLPVGQALRGARCETVPLGDVVDDIVAVAGPDVSVADRETALGEARGHRCDSASVEYLVAVPGELGVRLVISFRAIGGRHVDAEAAHADSIVRTLRWT
ncbi:hypothetical protein ES689_08140 [Frigoribacterium sp. ACAM 257]|uniref:hypothetical protein n=1 Tax=Frigoribacterium sp. ACAM 257 TaxID=2508998 RepID=UPI0011BA1BCA|nr:hypothetical protein [Frigoribacterium sp. ACAM 257]TWX38585.1 hypothetical protein ES689_08140 [Frigoribacterium sp. ACAM 257]